VRLELHNVQIRDIRFGNTTRIQDGALSINRNELRTLLEKDRRFGQVDIELARPGEKCRIFRVADVLEPRAKMETGGEDFLTFAEKHSSTGVGKTCALKGAAIALIDLRKKGGVGGGAAPRDDIIDMSGPAAEFSEYGKMFTVALLPQPKEGVAATEYLAALKLAGLKASAYLARVGESVPADETEVYDLPSLTDMAGGAEGLPKITYIYQILSLQYEPIPGEPTLFHRQAEGIMPTILHPNQVLDGAITSAFPGLNTQTYRIQNHPIIKELYKRHGKDLCFAGVIVMVAHNNVADFDRMANIAAGMAKWVVGADGAVLTKTSGGAPELAMARTAQRCEQLGVKTALAMLHMGADYKDAKFGALTIFDIPEVDAIVSMGFPYMKLTLPPVERTIGYVGHTPGEPPPEGELEKPLGSLCGSLCQLGSSHLTAIRY